MRRRMLPKRVESSKVSTILPKDMRGPSCSDVGVPTSGTAEAAVPEAALLVPVGGALGASTLLLALVPLSLLWTEVPTLVAMITMRAAAATRRRVFLLFPAARPVAWQQSPITYEAVPQPSSIRSAVASAQPGPASAARASIMSAKSSSPPEPRRGAMLRSRLTESIMEVLDVPPPNGLTMDVLIPSNGLNTWVKSMEDRRPPSPVLPLPPIEDPRPGMALPRPGIRPDAPAELL
mmetsp:Transcript_23823/g.51812  ORF Transcript_23823/g.51812 Transcript_23823/m.51812 type:complete len:235 (+) Transcript_23823:148-852(+)